MARLRPGAWRGKAVRAPVPVVCIGNPTIGGAGKTPTAIAVAPLLRDIATNPVFLTRGYGGRLAGPVMVASKHNAADVGDEPLLLARVAPTVVARDRVAGATAAVDAGADIIVMDDGFQNPSLHKDLSILVVDGRRGLGNGRVFPAGPLRAPLPGQLALAQVLLVIGAPNPAVASLMEAMAPTGPRLVTTGRLIPDPVAVAALAGARVLAFAGIGDADKFYSTLRDAGITVAATQRFDDHHCFSATEAADLIAKAEQSGLTLVTTEKDLARMVGDPALAALVARARPLPVTLDFDQPEALRDLLKAMFAF
jgi:tetraacyldisaccharide 4'-kinase